MTLRKLLPLAVAALMAQPLAAQQTDIPQVPGAGSTADHSKFEILQKDFKSGPEVTEACMTCHTEADNQIMHSIHFSWKFEDEKTGDTLGKSKVINAFCGNVAGNEPRCTSCHAGYGWDDMSVDPTAADSGVTPDCLVCHDTSGQYTKLATGAGHVPTEDGKGTTITGETAWAVDLKKSAQSVGMPTKDNCGQCHFYGGGGDNVKHGDLSSALYDPSVHTDVHMSKDGANMECTACHVSSKENTHVWAGSRYEVLASDPLGTGKPGERRDVATCESCHGNTPHPINIKGVKLNDHTDKVACQTCHIPEYAKGGVPTKSFWDWSTAGKLNAQGKPYHEENFTASTGKHYHTYLSTKGDFEWEENAKPVYAWFNGTLEYTMPTDTIDPTQVVPVNNVRGGPEDGRIWPFKQMRGAQPYDAGNNTLTYSHVWGPDTDTAFWTNFDWAKAIEAGNKAAGADYSGEFGFVKTEMYWPITHMVAPAEEAMECEECHAENGRLANISGVFMPGTTPNSLVSWLGRLIVLGALAGALGHLILRMVSRGKHHEGDA